MTQKNKNLIASEITKILCRVEKDGDKALKFFMKKFDGIMLSASRFRISKNEIRKSYDRISPSVKFALLTAKKRIEFFHKEELKRMVKNWSVQYDGIRVGQIVSPLSSVGVYVPGGRTCYPSTVLMTGVPAKVAGVKQVVMVTPPSKLTDEVLAAAYVSGVDLCFRVGGPAAIAALAYGTRTIPKVEKIVGPGNKYVTEAKRQVFGRVGIDGLAGPSEVAVWADSSADVSRVVVNLLAQSEHDPDARSFFLTSEKTVLSVVRKNVPKEFLRQIEFIFCNTEKRIVEMINNIAPEHLYLAVKNPQKALSGIRNAGAIFLGEETPVALGDYVAGPSHVLPTGKAARFGSGLSVKDFFKWNSIIEKVSEKSMNSFESARILAEVENLRYHADSLMAKSEKPPLLSPLNLQEVKHSRPLGRGNTKGL